LGIPYGTATYDSKGQCCTAATRDVCYVCNGPGPDACDQCYDKTDSRYMDPKLGGLDICGTCLKFGAPEFNRVIASSTIHIPTDWLGSSTLLTRKCFY
jgi:hypothetical protein